MIPKEAQILIGDHQASIEPGRMIEKSQATNVPCILEPGQIKLISIGFDSKAISKAKDSENHIFAAFTFLSSQGKRYETIHEITPIGAFGTKDEENIWRPFRLGNHFRVD